MSKRNVVPGIVLSLGALTACGGGGSSDDVTVSLTISEESRNGHGPNYEPRTVENTQEVKKGGTVAVDMSASDALEITIENIDDGVVGLSFSEELVPENSYGGYDYTSTETLVENQDGWIRTFSMPTHDVGITYMFKVKILA